MSSENDGTVSVSITFNESTGFIFAETANTTDGAVAIVAGQRLFEVFNAGTYLLAFTATNFTLASPPVGFPHGDPDWLVLLSGATATQFSMQVTNTGTVPNQDGTFLIHQADGAVVDPTVINNPIGTFQREPLAQHRSARA